MTTKAEPKLYLPGSCPSKTQAIRRVARKVASTERKLIEAAEWCEYHGLTAQAMQLRSMSQRAGRISREIEVAADRQKAPGTAYTRKPRKR